MSVEWFMCFQMKWRSRVRSRGYDAKKFDSVFVFRSPDHPNLRDENQTGRFRDCQVETPELPMGNTCALQSLHPLSDRSRATPSPTCWKLSVAEKRTMI